MNRRHLLGFSALALTLGPTVLWAQDSKKPFTPEQLDQLLAPIALYPDALLSQTLMAATYPLEVVEAARWTQANPNLKGDAAVQAVKNKDWDVSVKSLVAFPQTLAMMNNNLDWTQKLGDAMIGQQKDVADSIQRLRAKAAAAGNLKTTPQQKVTTQTTGSGQRHRHRAGQSRSHLRAVLQPDLGVRAVALSRLSAGLLSAAAQLRRGVGDRHDVRPGRRGRGGDVRRLALGLERRRLGQQLHHGQRQPRDHDQRQQLRRQPLSRRPVAARPGASRRRALSHVRRARALQPGAAGRPAARAVPRPAAMAATLAANREQARPTARIARRRRSVRRPAAARTARAPSTASIAAGRSIATTIAAARRGATAASIVAAAASTAAAAVVFVAEAGDERRDVPARPAGRCPVPGFRRRRALPSRPPRSRRLSSSRAFPPPTRRPRRSPRRCASNDQKAIAAMWGANWRDFVPGTNNDVQRRRAAFLKAWDESHKLVMSGDAKAHDRGRQGRLDAADPRRQGRQRNGASTSPPA